MICTRISTHYKLRLERYKQFVPDRISWQKAEAPVSKLLRICTVPTAISYVIPNYLSVFAFPCTLVRRRPQRCYSTGISVENTAIL